MNFTTDPYQNAISSVLTQLTGEAPHGGRGRGSNGPPKNMEKGEEEKRGKRWGKGEKRGGININICFVDLMVLIHTKYKHSDSFSTLCPLSPGNVNKS